MFTACRDYAGGLFVCGVQQGALYTLIPEMFILY